MTIHERLNQLASEIDGMRSQLGDSSLAVTSAARTCELLVENFKLRSAEDAARVEGTRATVASYLAGFRSAVEALLKEAEEAASKHYADAKLRNEETMAFYDEELSRLASTLKGVRAARLDGGNGEKVEESPTLPPLDLGDDPRLTKSGSMTAPSCGPMFNKDADEMIAKVIEGYSFNREPGAVLIGESVAEGPGPIASESRRRKR